MKENKGNHMKAILVTTQHRGVLYGDGNNDGNDAIGGNEWLI